VCGLFCGSIGGGVHILLIQVWVSFIGLPFGLLAFLVFALVILASANSRQQRGALSLNGRDPDQQFGIDRRPTESL
jgi:hypothetical protein